MPKKKKAKKPFIKKYEEKDMDVVDLALAPSIDLPPFVVTKMLVPKDGEKFMVLEIEADKDWRPETCPKCHCTDINLEGRSKKRIVHDISRNNYCIDLVLNPRRYRCGNPACDYRFQVPMDGFKRGATVTDRVIEYIQKEAFFQKFQIIAERTGLTSTTVANYFDEKIAEFDSERKKNPVEAPSVLGIDEKHNAHKAMGVLVDAFNNRLLEMTVKNDKASMIKAIKSLNNWDKNIKVVTTDMASDYHSWLPSLLPNATLVVDKFHVMQGVNKAMNDGKKSMYPYLKNKILRITNLKEREKKMAILRYWAEDRFLLNYSVESLEEDKEKEKQVASLIATFPEIALFKQMASKLEKMYTMKTRKDAEKCFDDWQDFLPPANGKRNEEAFKDWCDAHNVPPGAFIPFRKFRSTSSYPKYKEAILNYFLPGCAFTNGVTEGFNKAIDDIIKRGNGYGFNHLRALAVYAPMVHGRVTYKYSIKKATKWVSATDPNMFAAHTNLAESLGTIRKIEVPVHEFSSEIIDVSKLTANILSSDARRVLYSDNEHYSVPVVDYTEKDGKIVFTVKK